MQDISMRTILIALCLRNSVVQVQKTTGLYCIIPHWHLQETHIDESGTKIIEANLPLFDGHQHIAGCDGSTFFDEDLFYLSILVGQDVLLHLHSL